MTTRFESVEMKTDRRVREATADGKSLEARPAHAVLVRMIGERE